MAPAVVNGTDRQSIAGRPIVAIWKRDPRVRPVIQTLPLSGDPSAPPITFLAANRYSPQSRLGRPVIRSEDCGETGLGDSARYEGSPFLWLKQVRAVAVFLSCASSESFVNTCDPDLANVPSQQNTVAKGYREQSGSAVGLLFGSLPVSLPFLTGDRDPERTSHDLL